MLEILWNRSPQDRDNPIRTGRAAPVPASLYRAFEAYFGIELFEASAMFNGYLVVPGFRP